MLSQRAFWITVAGALASGASCGDAFQLDPTGGTGGAGGATTGATTSSSTGATSTTASSSTSGGGAGGGPCVPAAEVCNGADDDCDDAVDEGIADVTCGLGECQVTVSGCDRGQAPPCEPLPPSPDEACDGADDNCNGTVDEGCSCEDGAVASCYGGPAGTEGVGLCHGGTQTCVRGQWSECDKQVVPSPESCNGEDDDCDGTEDEGDPGGGAACNTGQPGVCGAGVAKCVSGNLQCVAPQPSPELCNGLDDDCDNATDEGNPGGGAQCNTGQPGACAAGAVICLAGAHVCQQQKAPSDEVCGNGVDDDCDGLVDQVVVYFVETFGGGGAGWTLGLEWQIKTATVSSGQSVGYPDPAVDHTNTLDNAVAGVVIGGNAATGLHPYRYLTSPSMAASFGPRVHLRFWRWLNTDFAPYMDNAIEVFDGAAWVPVWTSGMSTVEDAEWTLIDIDISEHVNPALQIRFGHTVGMSGAFVVSSWNLDDIALVNTTSCN